MYRRTLSPCGAPLGLTILKTYRHPGGTGDHLTMGFGKDGKGAILSEQLNTGIGALATAAGVRVAAAIVLADDFRIIKTELTATIRGLANGEGAGLRLHLMNGNLTLAEAEGQLEADGPTDRNDRTLIEAAERFVKVIGLVEQPDPAGTEAVFRGVEGGPIIEKTIRWTFSDNDGWAWLIYNTGDTLTTGATVFLQAKHFGVWLT